MTGLFRKSIYLAIMIIFLFCGTSQYSSAQDINVKDIVPNEALSDDVLSNDVGGDDLINKRDLCRFLKRYEFNNDDISSSADYVPNIDAYGRDVAPADLPSDFSGQNIIPDRLNIPLEVELESLFENNDALTRALDLDADLGDLQINTLSGHLTLNGQPISQDDLISYCQ